MTRLAALSVDLDEVNCYAAIHGLSVPPGSTGAIYRHAVRRFAALFDELGVKATFFAIGSDIDEEVGSILNDLAAAGHEIGNHSDSHLYDLTRQPRAVMVDELALASQKIEQASGQRPVGFRAPGYTINDELFGVLEEQGYAYDSSVFPCPAYFGAKATAIGVYQLKSMVADNPPSQSIVDDPRVLSAPADPYRVGVPYWRRGSGIVELPIGVTRGPRLPYIGTSVVMSGPGGADLLTRAIAGRPLVNLELHGIDLADADEDGLQWLRPHQVDLRRGAAQKERALRAAVSRLRAEGYELVTLADAAAHFA